MYSWCRRLTTAGRRVTSVTSDIQPRQTPREGAQVAGNGDDVVAQVDVGQQRQVVEGALEQRHVAWLVVERRLGQVIVGHGVQPGFELQRIRRPLVDRLADLAAQLVHLKLVYGLANTHRSP